MSAFTKMKDLPRYQEILGRIFSILRLPQFARFWNRTNTTILCYHGITERSGLDPDDRSAIAVDRGLFLAHLTFLKRYYTVISLNDYLVARHASQPLPRHSVILTFDDGFRNFLTVAAPALKEFGFSATIFLITDQVGQRDQSSLASHWTPIDDRISLSWSEAKKLQFIQAVEFGSHTCSHPELLQFSMNAERELCDSLSAIRGNLDVVIPPSLAYPHGNYSESIAASARLAGYSCVLTTESGSNSVHTDLFQLRRNVVHRYDTIDIFAARVSGLTGWLRMARDAFRRLSLPLIRIWSSTFSPSSSS